MTNPLDARESMVRTSLRPGLLKALAYNASHRNDGAGLFELGKVFLPPAEGQERPRRARAPGRPPGRPGGPGRPSPSGPR